VLLQDIGVLIICLYFAEKIYIRLLFRRRTRW
jgi:hypothetical protein